MNAFWSHSKKTVIELQRIAQNGRKFLKNFKHCLNEVWILNNPSDQAYKSKWKSVADVLWNSGLKVSQVAKAGSRAKGTSRPDSDMDVIFSVSENPSRDAFYPKLLTILKSNFSYDKVYPGTSYNVIHIDFSNKTKFDVVLLPKKQFNTQYTSDENYRRKTM